MPWLALKAGGVEIRMVCAEGYALPVEKFIEQIDDHTRMIAVSHVQASTGYTVDLAALGRLVAMILKRSPSGCTAFR